MAGGVTAGGIRRGSRRYAVLVVLLSLMLALPLARPSAAGGGLVGRGGRGERGMRGQMRAGGRGPGARGRGRMFRSPHTAFEAAYVQWNHPYKRALLATSRGTDEQAKRVLGAAQEQWYSLLGAYYLSPPLEFAADPQWQTDLAAITGYLQIATWQLYGGDMGAAHSSLEPVRRIWLDVRERNEVPWFGDRLTRYHDLMEPVVMWATGAADGGVAPDNIDEFDAQLKTLVAAWMEVVDSARRTPPPGNTRQFAMAMEQEHDALKALDAASAEGRYEDIPEAARGVQKAFIQLYMGFG
jgi:hypothetical protein